MSSKLLTRKELEDLIRKQDDSIVYIEKRKTASLSYLWKHFYQVFVNTVQQLFVSCNICKSLLAYTSANGTKNMKTHLSSCTKSIVKTIDENQKSVKEFYSSSTTTVIPKRIKSSVIMTCAKFAALDGRAFDTMSGTGFLNLAKQLLDADRLLGNSSTVKIEDLIPHSTTVRNIYFCKL